MTHTDPGEDPVEAAASPRGGFPSRMAAVLDLLADGSSWESFESAVDVAMSALTTPCGPDEVARLDVAARRVFRSLERERERYRCVVALYHTAQDLAEVRDVDAVLEAIVRRVNRVVPAADVALLVLRDEDSGDYYLQASVGLGSTAARRLRVPKGQGLAGVIERTRAPVQVRRYLAADSFERAAEIDEAFVEEGLTTVLGAPFLLHGEVVGILCAANRQERSYGGEQTAMLAKFAEHAAVALGNARVVADLAAAHRTVLRDARTMERAGQLHESLTALLIRGADLGDVAEELARAFRRELVLVGWRGEVITTRGGAGAERTRIDPATEEAIAESRRSGRCVIGSRTDGWCYVFAVGSGLSQLNALVLRGEMPLSDLDVRTFERVAQIVGLTMMRQDAIADAERRVRGELLTELLSHRRSLAEATRLVAQSRGFDLGRRQIALAIRVPDEQRPAARRSIADIARNAGGLGGDHDGVLAAVVPGEDARQTAEWLRGRIGAKLAIPVLVCAAMPTDPRTGQLATGFTVARRCLPLLSALGHEDAAVTTRDLALYSILFDPERAGDLRAFVDSTLEPLTGYDREHHTDLVKTVSVFLRNGSNATRTARDLYVHLNTVAKRLDRVATLLGADWQSEPKSLQLRLALHLHDLSRRTAEA